MKVYCCFSLYNLYIALAKAMVQNEKIDLVIGSQMPDYKNKIETIKSLDFINDIYVFDSVDYKNIKYKNIFDKITNEGRLHTAIKNGAYMKELDKEGQASQRNPMTRVYKIVDGLKEYLE